MDKKFITKDHQEVKIGSIVWVAENGHIGGRESNHHILFFIKGKIVELDKNGLKYSYGEPFTYEARVETLYKEQKSTLLQPFFCKMDVLYKNKINLLKHISSSYKKVLEENKRIREIEGKREKEIIQSLKKIEKLVSQN